MLKNGLQFTSSIAQSSNNEISQDLDNSTSEFKIKDDSDDEVSYKVKLYDSNVSNENTSQSLATKSRQLVLGKRKRNSFEKSNSHSSING